MTQDERNTQLQRENTTLIQKVNDRENELAIFKARVAELVAENTALQLRVDSLSDSVLMANELLKANDKQAEEYRIAIDDLVSELSARDSGIATIRSEAA